LAPRDAAANKGNFGHVLVVGGSLGKAGAAAMAGMSALRAGAGLSSIATPKSVLATVAGFHPEYMTEPLEETDTGSVSLRALEYGRMDHIVHGKTVLAIGPGISRHSETAEFVRTIVARYAIPTVLDADGLNAFEGQDALLNGSSRPLVLTPHPGEMARLAQTTTAIVQADRVGVARAFARDHHAVVILKGFRTLIALPDEEIWVNPTGNPGMATGGTGDILTGLVSGLIAQHPHRIAEAAIAAVFLHGMAGDIARETTGESSLVATDLVKTLPEAFRRARQAAGADLVSIGGI
jgi:NAD(P)H-hydrate epimerase